MEKCEYYLSGKMFDLTTDHKAVEEIKRKKEFGSARIKRRFERLERFQYKVIYKPGNELILADAISRLVSEKNQDEDEKQEESSIHFKKHSEIIKEILKLTKRKITGKIFTNSSVKNIIT